MVHMTRASEKPSKVLVTLERLFEQKQETLLPRLETRYKQRECDVTMRQYLARGKLWHGLLFGVACHLGKPRWLVQSIPQASLHAALVWATGHDLVEEFNLLGQLGDSGFLAARFSEAAEYYQRKADADARCQQFNVEQGREPFPNLAYGVLSGWQHGDMDGFRTYVHTSMERSESSAVEHGHPSNYFRCHLLGEAPSPAYVKTEHQAEEALRAWVREQWGRCKAPEAVEAVHVDDWAARAAYWIGDFERAASHAAVALHAISRWSRDGSPAYSFDGSKGMRRQRLEGIALLATRPHGKSAARKAAGHFRKAILSSVRTHQPTHFDLAILHLQACREAGVLLERVETFQRAFPHLRHAVALPLPIRE